MSCSQEDQERESGEPAGWQPVCKRPRKPKAKAAKKKEPREQRRRSQEAAKRRAFGGVKVHDFRLWPRIYPATGHEGYVPLTFVFTGKTVAQRESRMRRLEQAIRCYFAGTLYAGGGITTVDYNQSVPVVVTELERITADRDGAAGKVWRRLGRDEWQTLIEALDNPDGDRLYVVQAEQARRRQKEREAAAREAKRPMCGRCGAKFTDERWRSIRHYPAQQHRELCDPCLTEHREQVQAEQAARRQAEEAAAREAAEAEARKGRGLFGRRG